MVSNKEIIEQSVNIIEKISIDLSVNGYAIYSKIEIEQLLKSIVDKIKAINY